MPDSMHCNVTLILPLAITWCALIGVMAYYRRSIESNLSELHFGTKSKQIHKSMVKLYWSKTKPQINRVDIFSQTLLLEGYGIAVV